MTSQISIPADTMTTTKTTTETTGPPVASATIIGFTDNSQVQHTERVTGTAAVLPANHDVWIVVQPLRFPKFHPQAGPVVTAPGGQWTAVAYFGRSPTEDTTERFALMVVSTSAEGSGKFKQYLADGPTQGYQGMDALPPGTVTLATVTVTRR